MVGGAEMQQERKVSERMMQRLVSHRCEIEQLSTEAKRYQVPGGGFVAGVSTKSCGDECVDRARKDR